MPKATPPPAKGPETWPCKHLLFHKEETPVIPTNEDEEARLAEEDAVLEAGGSPRGSRSPASPRTKIISVATVIVAGDYQLRLDTLPTKGLFDWGACLALCDAIGDRCRKQLLAGARVVELGCGHALPAMMCATLGGRVLATDLPEALAAPEANLAASGWPQRVWKVAAGHSAGLPVFPADPEAPRGEIGRLVRGVIVEEIMLRGDVLEYRILEGRGPQHGTVCVRRFGGAELLRRTTERPPLEGVPGSIRTFPLNWSSDDDRQALVEDLGNVDIIVCSDCVSEQLLGESWEALADCIEALLHGPEAAAYVSLHRRKGDAGVDNFLECLDRKGLLLENLFSKIVLGADLMVYCVRKPSRSEGFVRMLDSKDGRPR